MSEHIVVERGQGVMTLRINRPDKRNALTNAMYDALSDGLDAALDPDVRTVVITGGNGIFTSGNDVADFLAMPPANGELFPVERFLRTISSFPKPLIAAVPGMAVGVGTTMLLHCDLVYASEDASFQLPFVNIGLVPEAASSLLLPQRVGLARAAEMFYFGDALDAREAERLGIVNKVVPAGDLDAFVRARAEALVRQPPSALRETKRLLRHAASVTVPERLSEEAEVFMVALRSPEAVEAMSAFMEKRKPDFSRFT